MRLAHISAGDLLREQKDREPPEIKEQIEQAMLEEKLVPASVIMPILRKEIEKHVAIGDTKILLDGFPRNLEQAMAFMEEVGSFQFLAVPSIPASYTDDMVSNLLGDLCLTAVR